MHRSLLLVSLFASSTLAGGSPPLGDGPPAWAYPVNPPGLTESPDDGSRLQVPDSDAAFTLTQIRDLNFCPDWHPGDHPHMPQIVARGRRPAVLACGSCHRADGSGGPENARVAGLPAAYIAQQMADFKSGARKTSIPGRNPERMVEIANAITTEEIKAAADYFSALSGQGWSLVTEPSHAVFLSYASQDTEAAQRVCGALRAAGIEVWFDRSELRGGDAWDQRIRKQIKTCALFVPIISKHTHERAEGYFRLEWKLAVDRSHLIMTNKAFLVPVVIDDTADDDENVPEKFREVQWMRLPAGQRPLEFVTRIQQLLSGESPQSNTLAREPIAAISGRSSRLGRASFSPSPHSIAVLPFSNITGSPDMDYLGDGMSEELIQKLTRVPGFRVPARTSSFAYKGRNANVRDIARDLNVALVIEGSVRTAGGHIRVTAQVIDARSGYHVWSQTYDRQLADIFALQDELASAVVNAPPGRWVIPRATRDYLRDSDPRHRSLSALPAGECPLFPALGDQHS